MYGLKSQKALNRLNIVYKEKNIHNSDLSNINLVIPQSNGYDIEFSWNGQEYEFVVDGEKMYRVMSQFITIKYEYQGNEEEYNPSWA